MTVEFDLVTGNEVGIVFTNDGSGASETTSTTNTVNALNQAAAFAANLENYWSTISPVFVEVNNSLRPVGYAAANTAIGQMTAAFAGLSTSFTAAASAIGSLGLTPSGIGSATFVPWIE